MTDSKTPPKYDVATVEAVILEVAAELHPRHLTGREFSLKIVSALKDDREVETAAQAIPSLREYGVFKDLEDEIVEPTPAALRVCTYSCSHHHSLVFLRYPKWGNLSKREDVFE